jgi:hypothetical protein
MENLEQQLSQLPKAKLSKKADFKIKFKIYTFILSKNLQKLLQAFLHPHSLVAKVSLMALAIFVLLGGTAVYAVNNNNITPGSALYPLKKSVENVEQQLSLTKKSKVDTLNKLSERRVKEAMNLVEGHLDNTSSTENAIVSNNIKDTINEVVDNVDSAIQASQKIDNKQTAQKVKATIKKQNDEMIKYLDDIENITKDANKEVSEKVSEAKNKIREYNTELQKEEDENKKERVIKKPDTKKQRDRKDVEHKRLNDKVENNQH